MYECKRRVGFSEIDENRRLKITALINYLQDTCTFQSEDTGYPLEKLMEDGMGWFLLTWHIKIEELPMFGEEVTIKTWPNKYSGIMAGRNFTVEKDGKVITSADSNWVLMDKAKLRPLRVPKGMVDAYGLSDPLPGEWMGRKLRAPENPKTVYEFTVSPMHLDTNRHMNNAFYIDAALAAYYDDPGDGSCDSQQSQEPSPRSVTEIRVEYRNQAVLGDHILVQREDNSIVLATKDKILSIIEIN